MSMIERHWCNRRAASLIAALFAVCPAAAQQALDPAQCRAIQDPTARLKCYENLTAPEAILPNAAPSSPASQNIGRWRLVRTPNPRGGKEAVSIMRTGELANSDPEFAGLMVRCGDADIEVLLVLVKPIPFRAKPRVSIGGARFDSTVAPPGSAILLPAEVGVLARQSWPSLPRLAVEVDESGTITKGTVGLDDFDVALKALDAACALRQ